MSNTINFKSSLMIEEGKVKELSLNFTGDLNTYIEEYFRHPKDSMIYKLIYQALDKASKCPMSIEDL